MNVDVVWCLLVFRKLKKPSGNWDGLRVRVKLSEQSEAALSGLQLMCSSDGVELVQSVNQTFNEAACRLLLFSSGVYQRLSLSVTDGVIPVSLLICRLSLLISSQSVLLMDMQVEVCTWTGSGCECGL